MFHFLCECVCGGTADLDTCIIMLTWTQNFALTENKLFFFFKKKKKKVHIQYLQQSHFRKGRSQRDTESISILSDLFSLFVYKHSISTYCIVFVHSRPSGSTVADHARLFLPLVSKSSPCRGRRVFYVTLLNLLTWVLWSLFVCGTS